MADINERSAEGEPSAIMQEAMFANESGSREAKVVGVSLAVGMLDRSARASTVEGRPVLACAPPGRDI